MSKFINKSQIIGEKGVAAFHDYCANHVPPLLWREETKNDFGIDGEIEIIKSNDASKLEVTGEILKVQIKSTETGSYISNETPTQFEFTATSEDILYWKNHKLSVLLVIYFVKENKLFSKKVDNLDLEKSKKRLPILFDKETDILIKNENNFLQKFSDHFRDRVNYDTTETLYTNIFKYSRLPKFINEYNSKVANKQEIYDSEIENFPEFILHSSKMYSFVELRNFPDFFNQFVESKEPNKIYFAKFIKDPSTRNYAIELINKYFRGFCFKKGIGFNKQYNRFFFKKFLEEPESKEEKQSFKKEVYRTVSYFPKTHRKKKIEREVVTRYIYYEKTDFFRHFAFQIYYFFDFENLYIAITPKYLFTSNGKTVLEDKKRITKYTNYLTSREFNQQVLNHIYFIFQCLSDNRNYIELANSDNCKLSISRMEIFEVPFGIDYSIKDKSNNKDIDDAIIQGKLFDI